MPAVLSMYRNEMFPAPDVPACNAVDEAYFEGAVLVGDSTAEGLKIHAVIPTLEVLTVIGISPRTAATNKLFKHDGKAVTLAEKLEATQPDKVYLWLGSNGVDTKTEDQVLDDYDRLLNVLIPVLPQVPFYLLELTPVKLIAQEQYKNYTNERVDAFNEGLREVARRHGAYVLEINTLFRNEKGLLDNEYGAGDGIHLRGPAYDVLAAYMRTHALPVEGE